ncbi:endolytic transglycosylase MltG [Pasteuria penetrans]|uniref:endolytic transglycosylase MltG n=1 Tax=Pasteuria penetrans TaxID=86005 RepID=UPI001CAA7990|nr:endolytic transglycosylase MltG [Pasteuria penetrans]
MALLVSWLLLGSFFFYYGLGSDTRSRIVYLQILPKTSTKKVGEILEDVGVIRDRFAFYSYVAFLRLLPDQIVDRKRVSIQAGTYAIWPDEQLWDVMDKLEKGRTSVHKLIVPEGSNVMDIAMSLERHGYDPKQFLRALRDRRPFYEFESYIGYVKGKKYQLEGFLVPATYPLSFPRTPSSETQLVDDMLKKFQVEYWEGLHLKEYLYSSSNNNNFDLNELITIASLVQGEGKIIAEYPRIAGVILNRLRQAGKYRYLSIDAANLYPFRVRGEFITAMRSREKNSDDPYNTYKRAGLPPGPIGNPEIQAVQSALSPEEHNFLFYVLRCDSSGLHSFGSTLAEHDRLVRQNQPCPPAAASQ